MDSKPAVSDVKDVLPRELLLKLADELGLDLAVLLELNEGYHDDDGLLAAAHIDLHVNQPLNTGALTPCDNRGTHTSLADKNLRGASSGLMSAELVSRSARA